MPVANIDNLLDTRQPVYGDFTETYRISDNIKKSMMDSPNWNKLRPEQREALNMLAVKIARILGGDPDYLDNWVDVGGYARLVEKTICDRTAPSEVIETTPVKKSLSSKLKGALGKGNA